MRFFILLLLSVNFLFAEWVFVNDDGSFSPYGETEESYIIIDEEIAETKVFTPIVRKKPKLLSPKTIPYQDGLKTMYLTFDDGPLAGSANIISVLAEEAVAATMFMVGKHVNRGASRKRVYQRAIDEPLILVANHTYAHANGRYRDFYSSKAGVVHDLEKMEAMLLRDDVMHSTAYTRLAGRNVFRLPGIHQDDAAIKKKYAEASKYDALYEAGFFIYGWDYQWSYNPKSGRVNQNPQQLAAKIEKIYQRGKMRKAHKFILLMHDFSFKDRLSGKRTLKELIHILRESGWRFETLETYL